MRKKILLVEDNAELLELWRLRMEAEGFAAATATDGVDALNRARELHPEALVLDLVLPELDGFAVCERLRRDRKFRSMPILLVTGLTSIWARQAGLHAGASEYVTKPVNPEHLVSRIRHWVQVAARPGPEPKSDHLRVAAG